MQDDECRMQKRYLSDIILLNFEYIILPLIHDA